MSQDYWRGRDGRLRLATRIHNQLTARHRFEAGDRISRIRTMAGACDRVSRLGRLLERCRDRGWSVATGCLLGQMERVAGDALYELRQLQHEIAAVQRSEPPTLADLVDELYQLDQEFDTVQIGERGHTLTVHTEPITLEEVALGPFAIELDLTTMDRSRPRYEIEALEPNPASGNDDVPHPHVQSGRLCEGEATAALTAALQQGRLCEFFLIVGQVLRTYNPSSPYVKLEDWDSAGCHECNYRGDLSMCDVCHRDYCDECHVWDDHAEKTACLNCSGICQHDNRRHHPDSIETCDDCGETFCTEHLDEHSRCPACAEAALETPNLETPDESTPPDPAVGDALPAAAA
jgi:hypothetical protein